jgi:hypothetical protein
VAKASTFFAIPAFVSSGTPVLTLTNRQAVRQFNAGLPCGAKLVRTARGPGPLVVGTFRLTKRPGGGRCVGLGELASTAFEIERRRIKRWYRVPNPQGSETKPS